MTRALRETFSSPARLAATLRERVIEPEALFYCPGSLLRERLQHRSSGRLRDAVILAGVLRVRSGVSARRRRSTSSRKSSSRYPAQGPILQSGWLLGEDLLRDQANVVAYRVGKGYVVTLGTQVHFRAQNRATYKLLFNAMFHGPSTPSQRGGAETVANRAVVVSLSLTPGNLSSFVLHPAPRRRGRWRWS